MVAATWGQHVDVVSYRHVAHLHILTQTDDDSVLSPAHLLERARGWKWDGVETAASEVVAKQGYGREFTEVDYAGGVLGRSSTPLGRQGS